MVIMKKIISSVIIICICFSFSISSSAIIDEYIDMETNNYIVNIDEHQTMAIENILEAVEKIL